MINKIKTAMTAFVIASAFSLGAKAMADEDNSPVEINMCPSYEKRCYKAVFESIDVTIYGHTRSGLHLMAKKFQRAYMPPIVYKKESIENYPSLVFANRG